MRALSILPDAEGRAELERALQLRGDVHVCRRFEEFPNADTLARSMRAWAPAMVLIDITDPSADAASALLASQFPEVRRVAVHPEQSPEVFRRVLHLGMCELINPPFHGAQVNPVIDRIILDLKRNPPQARGKCKISAFMPAKAGVGASTLAAHFTWAAARNAEARVLLMDFDRFSGITAFQFNVVSDYTLRDALNNATSLDEDSWRTLTKSVKNMDLLVSRPGELSDLETERFVAPLIQFAQKSYTAIHIDLPDALDAHSLAALRQSDQIYIVATPELPSLRLAKLKAETLRKLELEGRAHLLLNRMSQRLGLSIAEIEEAVGMEVFETFPCDYEGVSTSLQRASAAPSLLDASAKFLARTSDFKKPEGYRQKFLERFSGTLPMLRSGQRMPSVMRS